jgi:hypothetical protein
VRASVQFLRIAHTRDRERPYLLIMHFDGSDRQYLVGLDKTTGRTAWTTQRSVDFRDLGPDGQPQAEGDYRKAFSTPYSASPIHASGRVYFFSEEGRSTVIEVGREFKVIGTSQLGDGFMA